MRAVMIVTYFGSELWEPSNTWTDPKFPHTSVRHKSIDDDEAIIVCQANSDEDREDRAMIDIRGKTTEWLVELANSAKYKEAQVYIATHAGYSDINQLATQISDSRFKAGAEFHHELDLPLFDALFALVNKADTGRLETVVDRIERQRKLTYAQRLSTLKHRLAHVFLPVSVDLHAWQEFAFDDLYLQEIREGYRFEEGRLERARSLLYCESSVSDNVEMIMHETRLDDDESWLAVKLLLPPKSREQEAEREVSDSYDQFKKAKAVLESLNDRDKLMGLRTELGRENAFGDWCKTLDQQLSQLVGKVQ